MVGEGRIAPVEPAPKRLRYQPALDGMRAIAALAVVGFHLRLPGFWGGGLGVDMFFTLSGFLITSILLAELDARGRISFRTFYARRALRLLPAYFAVVVAAIVGYLLIVPVPGTPRGAIASFFYVANWVAGEGWGLGTLAHTWSLSVEEQFYLLWPILLLVLFAFAVRRGRGLLLTVGAVWLLMWLLTLAAVFVFGVTFDLLNNATQFRATELLAGCLLAVLVRRGHMEWLIGRPRLSATVGVIGLLGLIALLIFGHAPSNPVLIATWAGVSLCTAMVIASVQGQGETVAGRILSFRPLVAVGLVSYGVYLWHFPVMVSIDALVGLDSLPAQLLSLALTAVLVVGSYFLIEKPFLRLKGRIGARKALDAGSSGADPERPERTTAPDAT